MQKKYLFIGIILIISLFLIACLPTGEIDPTDCPRLEGTAQDQCFFEKNECSQISDDTVRELCVVELAKVANDLQVCDLITDEAIKGNCQTQIAKLQNDNSICTQITSQYWINNCYDAYARANNNADFCNKIQDITQQIECYYDVAIESENYETCFEIDNSIEFKRDACINNVAKKTKDSQPCAWLSTDTNKATCILRIAKLSEDPNLCKTIQIGIIEETCDGYFIEQNDSISNQ
jgi:hypothetical protein